MPEPFSAALIAGGASRRFGSDKALFEFGGRPLWQTQIEKLESLDPAEVVISANASQRFETEHRVVVDEVPDRGPLGGLVTCLNNIDVGRLLILAVDVAAIPAAFLRRLADFGHCSVPRHANGSVEPLVAIYPKSIVDLAEQQLAKGRLAMRDLIDIGIETEQLHPFPIEDSEAALFVNLNERPVR